MPELVDFADPAFAARVRTREPEALAAVVHAYLPQVLRAARGAGLRPEEAQDTAQATFVTFVEVAPRFEGRSHVRTWLFGILYRKIAEARREAARDRRHEQLDDIDQVMASRFDARGSWARPPRSAEGLLLGKEVQGELEECLDQAPTPQRLAFVLREVEGLGTAEICNILEVTVTNLGVMLYRVRNRLRECLEAKGIRR